MAEKIGSAEAEAVTPFETRLIEAMADMANPAKDRTATVPTKNGGKYSYNYETLDQVLAIIRPALLAHGIGLTQQVGFDPATGGWVLRTVVFDADERMELDVRPLFMSADAQASGSFETYMRRYALRSAFGLCGEDDDGQVATNMARQGDSRPRRQGDGGGVPGRPKPPARQPHSAPDRQKMIAKCARLAAEFIERGGSATATKEYMGACFGTGAMADLTDEQIIQLGQHLSEVVGQLGKEQQ